MALRRAIGSLVVRSQAYYLRRAAPSPPPSFSRLIIPYRPFAAPPQHAKKVNKDDDDDAGPRINNDITAPFLRLVTDEGHSVVPRHEALQLAARMGLDLVEVHRKTDPPVCKIMDFHKEKYNKDVKEKERLKTKSAIVLRGGDNKEVRFKAKTEIKDLKVKADAITRLMERGYRVKCMAMPAGNEAEDLGGPLSRLLGLIQDVCIVESGPHLDSKHAYVIVRHVKFATKKGGKKASKAMEDAGKGTPRNTASESTAPDSGDETSEHGLEVENVDKTPAYLSHESLAQKERQDRGVGGRNRDNMDSLSAGGNRINPGQGGSQSSERGLGSRIGNSHMEKREKTNQDMVPEQTNRYASRRNQMGGDNQGRPPQDPRRNENEGRHRFNDNQRPFEQPSPPPPRFSQGRPPQDPRRNENEARHRFNDNQRPLEQPSPPSPRLSQGRPPQDLRRNERGSHVPWNNNQPPRFQQSNQNSGPLAGRDAGSPTPTARSLGAFSSRTPATTSEPKKADGAPAAGNPSDTGPTKSFGIFSTPRK